MGMSPLAIFLKGEDCQIEGFDDCPDSYVESLLKSNSIQLKKRDELDFENADTLIMTSALKREFSALKSKSQKEFLRRGEALAKIAKTRRLIGVCGSHGKTTTTTLISHAILKISEKSGFITGAMPINFPPARHCEQGEFLAAELDESDGTIENFSPEITVALNADLDHTDTYANEDALIAMFVRLFERTSKFIVIPSSDSALVNASKIARTNAKVVLVDTKTSNFLEYDKQMALTALNLAFNQNLTLDIFDDFKGVRRRQETIFESQKMIAIADYAHHPNEVSAFLKHLDSMYKSPRLIFFQPHRYTRTKYFGETFKKVFEQQAKLGDSVYILPVYAASEPFDANGTSKNLQSENVKLADFQEMQKIVEKFVEEKDWQTCVAFIGAGNIYFKAKEIFNYEKF